MNWQERRAAAKHGNAQSLGALAAKLKQAGRLEEAVALYRRALAADPVFFEAHNNLGNLLKQQGELDQAIGHFQQALALRPQSGQTHNNLGNALQQQGRFDEALGHYRRAVALTPDLAELHNSLGSLLHVRGDWQEAVASYEQALTLQPGHAAACINLGLVLADMGHHAEALAAARIAAGLSAQAGFPHFQLGLLLARCGCAEGARMCLHTHLQGDPEDRDGVRLLLARLGFEAMPERASDAQIERLYSSRALSWDQGAAGPNGYRGATLVAAAMEQFTNGAGGLDILDIGCGTGLVGALVRKQARQLVGVDLSLPMLAQAKDKHVYDALHRGDLIAFLNENANAFDVVTCAATLIHFGDLYPAFEAGARCLRDGGLFLVTLFQHEQDDNGFAIGSLDGLAQGGCYEHGRAYVMRLAETCGFTVEGLERHVHEHVQRTPRMAMVGALRRQPRADAMIACDAAAFAAAIAVTSAPA